MFHAWSSWDSQNRELRIWTYVQQIQTPSQDLCLQSDFEEGEVPFGLTCSNYLGKDSVLK